MLDERPNIRIIRAVDKSRKQFVLELTGFQMRDRSRLPNK